MERLRQRADFLAAATGVRVPATAFVLQSRNRKDHGPSRIGFTVSKKVGNAVERNRVRRRLREAVRLAQGDQGNDFADGFRAGHDYVLVGRRPALALPFDRIRQELEQAVGRAHSRHSATRKPAVTSKPASGRRSSPFAEKTR
jgi:ribonuclease P protein component